MMTQMKPEHAADQIVLLIDNDQPYYKQKYAMFESLEKKVRNKTYNRDLSLKLFKQLTDKVRIRWNKEWSADQEETMTVQGSRMADVELRHEFETDYLPNEKHIDVKGKKVR